MKTYEQQLPTHPDNIAISAGGDKEAAIPAYTAETRPPPPRALDLERDSRFEWYLTSKSAATNMVDDYVANNKSRHFSIVNVHPGWVLGPNPLAHNKQEGLNGSNMVLGWLFVPIKFNMFYGVSDEEPPVPLSSEVVHIDDVAEAHVSALNRDKVPGEYKNYILAGQSPYGICKSGCLVVSFSVLRSTLAWESAGDIVRKHYPEEVKSGKISIPGASGSVLVLLARHFNVLIRDTATLKVKFDAVSSEKELLGHPYTSFEKQVVDMAGWFMGLPDQ